MAPHARDGIIWKLSRPAPAFQKVQRQKVLLRGGQVPFPV